MAYVASADNPSDDPTRGKEVRKPTEPRAAWLRAAENGNLLPLDTALAEWGCAPIDVAALPPASKLMGTDLSLPADLRTYAASVDGVAAPFPGGSSISPSDVKAADLGGAPKKRTDSHDCRASHGLRFPTTV